MARKYSPSLIGGFVAGGTLLLIGALFLFGSGDLFKEKRRWVTYFEGSVGGLSPGAPVNFRGVRVGTVTDVTLMVDPKKLTAEIPVYFQIEPDRIKWVGGETAQSPQMAAAAGMRAKLSVQSIVTGQMIIELDLRPDIPAKLVGADPSTPELPSMQSEFDVFKEQLSQLPVQDLMASLDRTIRNIDRVVSSPEVTESLKAFSGTMAATQELVTNLNQDARPLMREVTATAQSARKTSDEATESLRSVSGELKTTLTDIRQLTTATRADVKATLRSADQAMQQARTTLASVDGLVAEDTQGRQDIERALQNLAQASSALRSFADTVENNPNAIIVGR